MDAAIDSTTNSPIASNEPLPSRDASFSHPSPSRKRNLSNASSSPWNDLIVILAGSNEYKLTAHAHALRKTPFFRGCLDAPMKGNAERTIRLPEDDPGTITQLVHWAYHGKFEYDLRKDSRRWLVDKTFPTPKVWEIIKVYLLGEKYMAEDLQNSAMDSIRSSYRYLRPSGSMMMRVLELTEAGYLLRTFMMARFSQAVKDMGGWEAAKEPSNSDHAVFAREKVNIWKLSWIRSSNTLGENHRPRGPAATGTSITTRSSAARRQSDLEGRFR